MIHLLFFKVMMCMCGHLVVLVGIGGVHQGNADPGPQCRSEEVQGLREGLHVVGRLAEEELQTCHAATITYVSMPRLQGGGALNATGRGIDVDLWLWQGSGTCDTGEDFGGAY